MNLLGILNLNSYSQLRKISIKESLPSTLRSSAKAAAQAFFWCFKFHLLKITAKFFHLWNRKISRLQNNTLSPKRPTTGTPESPLLKGKRYHGTNKHAVQKCKSL